MTRKKAYQKVLGGTAVFLVLTIIALVSPTIPESDQIIANGAAVIVVFSGTYLLLFLHRIFTNKKYRSFWKRTLPNQWGLFAGLILTGLVVGTVSGILYLILGAVYFFTGIFLQVFLVELDEWIKKLPND